jgi:hypothetical protein
VFYPFIFGVLSYILYNITLVDYESLQLSLRLRMAVCHIKRHSSFLLSFSMLALLIEESIYVSPQIFNLYFP